MGELSRHSLDLLLEVVPQPPKDACEQIPNSVDHLKGLREFSSNFEAQRIIIKRTSW